MIWVLLLGIVSYLILRKIAFIDNARQKYSRWVSVGDPSIRPEHFACRRDAHKIAPLVRCGFLVRGENYIVRGDKPLEQSDVIQVLLKWAEDARTSMTFTDAERFMDIIEHHDC